MKILGGDVFQKTSLFAFHIVTIAIALLLMLVTPFEQFHAHKRRASELKQGLVVEEKDLLNMDDADLAKVQRIFLRSRPLSRDFAKSAWTSKFVAVTS